MAKPTERAVKRKPMAVIMLTTKRSSVPEVPNEGREFEWFETVEGMNQFYDQVREFDVKDCKDHDDMAYMCIEITDTADMKIGRIAVAPETDATKKWLAEVKKDVTKALTPVTPTKKAAATPSKKVKPRQKTAAAKAVGKDPAPEAKAARLKDRLAAKKSEAGDKPSTSKSAAPKPRAATAKKTAAKKTSAAEDSKPVATEFVVKKASTDTN